jgi:uncharacterized protein YerC
VDPDLLELERRLNWALDQFEVRLAKLEDAKPAWRFTLADGIASRRRVVAALRESGLSYSQISQATGASVATIERDLQSTAHRRPRYVLGTDQKRHPTVKGGRVSA